MYYQHGLAYDRCQPHSIKTCAILYTQATGMRQRCAGFGRDVKKQQETVVAARQSQRQTNWCRLSGDDVAILIFWQALNFNFWKFDTLTNKFPRREISTCMHTHTAVCMHACTHPRTHARTHAHTHTHVHTCT